MTPREAIDLIRLIREHREWDELREGYVLDSEQFENAILAQVEDQPHDTC